MASSEDQLVRLALARGWLAQHQVEGALRSAAAQGLTLAQLLVRHRPDAAQELAVLARAAPVATTIAPPVAPTLAVQPTPQTHASPKSGAVLVPAPADEPGRARVVAALREALGRDPRFAPHLDLVLERRGVLGEGGMGVVHRVLDKRLGRLAALKVMKTERADPQDVARFFREAELTARLDHPSVPPVYEAGTDAAGRPYLLMRLIEGQPLSERIAALHRAGQPPPLHEVRELLEVLVKVGEAVARAHARGMVHRDLKPGNVMVGAHGEVLVLDWGLVRVLDGPDDDALLRAGNAAPTSAELTQAGALLGTPGYMSPEQAGGEPVDARTDVFALGAILCALLTGTPPVAGTSVLNVVANTVQGAIARPRDRWRGCPRELDSICAAALAFDRAGRTASAEAFVADLRAYLAGEDVPSHRYGALERLGRALRRRPAVAVSLAALAVVAGLAAAAWSQAEQRRAFQEAMRLLVDAEAAAGRPADAAAIVTRALERGGDAVRWDAARVLDQAGLSADAALVLAPTIDERAAPPPLRALLFLHLLQVHAAPDRHLSGERTEALRTLLRLAPGAPQGDGLRAFAAGQAALDEGRLPEALARFGEALEREGRLPWALLGRAEVHRRARRFDPAAADLGSAIEAAGADRSLLVLALSLRAELHLARTQMRLALADAERAVAVQPDSRRARLTCSLVLATLGRGAEAEEVLGPVLGGAMDAELLVARSRARLIKGDLDAGLADLERAAALAPRDPKVLGDRVRYFTSAGDAEKLRPAVQALLEAAPADPESLLLAAGGVDALGDLPGALREVERALALAPDLPAALRLRGQLRARQGDLDGANRDLAKALRLDPGDALTLIGRAIMRRSAGELPGALADLDAAVALAPDDAQALQLRAVCRTAVKDFQGALADYDALIALQPLRGETRSTRARIALELGDLVCAEQDAKAGLELDGGAYELAVVAMVALARKDMKTARERAQRALELDPTSLEARTVLERVAAEAEAGDPVRERLLRSGLERLVAGDNAAAERLATDAMLRGKGADAFIMRSRARGLQGNVRGALEDAEQAILADPTLPEAWLARGSSRLGSNDPQGALADAEEGLRRRAGDQSLRLLRAQARAMAGEVKEGLAELDELLSELTPGDPNRAGLLQLREVIAGGRR